MGSLVITELSSAEAAGLEAIVCDVVPETVAKAVAAIEAELPEYTRLQDPEHADFLSRTVERSIRGFLDLLLGRGSPEEELLEFFRDVGVIEAEEGLSVEVSQTAFRIGAGVAIHQLTEAAERHPDVSGVPGVVVGRVVEDVLGYLNRVAEAVLLGHADAQARAVGDLRLRRAQLIDQLITPVPHPGRIGRLAAQADWPLPRTAAAVALAPAAAGTRSGLMPPPDVLVGLHLDEPCLIVPDPEGPGRGRLIQASLRNRIAAIGPTVPVSGLAHSLRVARLALALPRSELPPGGGPIVAVEHLPLILLRLDPELTDTLLDHILAPLLNAGMSAWQIRRLAKTLESCLEHGFTSTAVAAALHVHAQTIRYRLKQLQVLFGDELHDPSRRLALHLAVRAWLARTAPGDPADSSRS
ncbi:helix-turn-helix domain-containing protein [Actinomadura fulvescens]|uniref:PucR family transcriptional regulator n=1 Tax=Actinomadura fulvescens TaxID=46160 RepID=A0ABP6DA78_9ACTN